MGRSAEALRRAAVAAGVGGGARGRQYPTELRSEIVEYVNQELGRGGTLAAASDAVGVAKGTLYRWLETAAPRLRPVRIAPALMRAAGRFTLVSPQGYRVEGLDIDSAAALLRSLS